MNNSDLRKQVLNHPGVAALVVHRAALSANKHGARFDEHLLNYARQNQKLADALHTAEGVSHSLRGIAEIIHDEKQEYYFARMRDSDRDRERVESLGEFVRSLTAVAESVMPGIYFDAVAA